MFRWMRRVSSSTSINIVIPTTSTGAETASDRRFEAYRAVDEYHIQAIAEDLYIIEDIFPSFNSLKYLYQEKLDNIFENR